MITQGPMAVGLVKPRLWKELRLLSLPAGVAALAACLVPVSALFEANSSGEGIVSLLKGFAWLTFLGCLLLIAAAPFGWEFQHRTMPMLLAQPCPRSRLWKEKMLAAALWILALCVLLWLAHVLGSKIFRFALLARGDLFNGDDGFATGEFIKSDLGFLLLWVPAALCAAPLWTIGTRSTIGGVTVTVATQFIAALVTASIADKAHLHQGSAFIVATVLYSLGCLWLGWRRFFTLEVIDGAASVRSDADYAPAPGPAQWREKVRRSWAGRLAEAGWLHRGLRCVPRGATTNLFRKELRLQKPVVQVGLLFASCWLVILTLTLIQPEKGYHHLFDVIIAFHIPLVFLLAGSVSISDENAHGVSGWHLTLPVTAGKQWGVKLAGSTTAGVAIGWLLPLVLLCATSLITQTGLSSRWATHQPGLFLLCASAALFVMSFWAVSLVGDTVRAVLMALVGLVVLFFAFLLAHWWARTNGGLSAVGVELLVGAVSVTVWNSVARFLPWVVVAFILVIAAVALLQSFQLFRRPDGARRSLLYYPAALILGALLMGAVVGDLESLRWRNQSQHQNLTEGERR